MSPHKYYAEIGLGNRWLISTEVEHGTRERRVKGFKLRRCTGVYLRIWIGSRVLVISKRITLTRKPRKAFKLLFGVEG